MASNNPDDMTDGASAGETAATRRARERTLGENPLSTEQMAEAIARAQERVRLDAERAKERPLPEIVRVSVRCGYENVTRTNGDGARTVITKPKTIRFAANETADGQAHEVEHGKPIRLTREAYKKYAGMDLVLLS